MSAPRRPQRTTRPSAPENLVARVDAAAAGATPADTVPSGFPSLDRFLGGGFRRGDLVVLGGDVGSGKSALALGMATRSSALGTAVLFLSGEMTQERLLERAIAQEGRAAVDDLRAGRLTDVARAAVGAAALRLRERPLLTRPLLGADFREVAEALDTVPRPALLVVDYLQLVAPPQAGANSEDEVGRAARALKAVALDRQVAVLALAQLPAQAGGRDDTRPTLDDYGSRGAVKQHADLVLSLYREEMYRPGHGVAGAAELIVAKNRNGPTGFVDLYFHRAWLRFEDMLDPEP